MNLRACTAIEKCFGFPWELKHSILNKKVKLNGQKFQQNLIWKFFLKMIFSHSGVQSCVLTIKEFKDSIIYKVTLMIISFKKVFSEDWPFPFWLGAKQAVVDVEDSLQNVNNCGLSAPKL